ncbi:hypothetical protein D3C87_1289250 [compost metagenome]
MVVVEAVVALEVVRDDVAEVGVGDGVDQAALTVEDQEAAVGEAGEALPVDRLVVDGEGDEPPIEADGDVADAVRLAGERLAAERQQLEEVRVDDVVQVEDAVDVDDQPAAVTRDVQVVDDAAAELAVLAVALVEAVVVEGVGLGRDLGELTGLGEVGAVGLLEDDRALVADVGQEPAVQADAGPGATSVDAGVEGHGGARLDQGLPQVDRPAQAEEHPAVDQGAGRKGR